MSKKNTPSSMSSLLAQSGKSKVELLAQPMKDGRRLYLFVSSSWRGRVLESISRLSEEASKDLIRGLPIYVTSCVMLDLSRLEGRKKTRGSAKLSLKKKSSASSNQAVRAVALRPNPKLSPQTWKRS